MLKVGLTGGLACGKSTVAQWMKARGARILQADDLAHELMAPGEPVFAEVVHKFGRGILKPDGAIDRDLLAQAAFGAGRIQELNAIVHPAVIKAQSEWFREVEANDPKAIAVAEAALIYEAGIQDQFDKIVVVTCSPEQKVERYIARVGPKWGPDQANPRLEAERRIAAQWPDEKKSAAADFVIDNSGTQQQTKAQVERLMDKLQQLASG